MASEQQAKRRRTESKATDSESLTTESPTAKPSPSATRRTPSAAAHSLAAMRSPATPVQQQHLAYYQDALGTSAAPQYQYASQQHTPQSHVSAYSQGTTPVPSASALAQAGQPRYLGGMAGPATLQQPLPGYQQLGASPHAAAGASSVTAASTHHQMAQAFVSPHAIPAAMLGQGSAVANADYGVWLYSQQHMPPPADRSAAAAVASSTSVSPVAQHALAPTDHAYPLSGQFDSQMRYMAVPGQASPAMPRPAVSLDRSYRMPAVSGPQHSSAPHHPHSLAAMQYTHHHSQPHYQTYHGYYQPHTHASYHGQQALQPHLMQPHTASPHYTQQQQQPPQSYHQHQPPHQQQQQQHQSPFPTHTSLAGTSALSDSSSGPASVGAGPASSGLHAGAYAHPVPLATEQASASVQMAAAVAAAAISAHTIPVSHSSPSGGTGTSICSSTNHTTGSAVVMDQSGIPAFKFSMGLQPGPDSSMPDYFETYTQNYVSSAPPIMEPSPASPAEQTLDSDLIVRLDELFMKYLEQICSNNITVDSEGESIHQTQMAKKLEKLEQCAEYRTFRFRIQAFSNGYREFIEREASMTEQIVSKQQLRNYLHQQRYISRYNEDGKKAKSKGHHVWNVEAKKMSRNTWWFKEFVRRIASPPPKAVIGVPYEWTPTIWDPQVKAPKVYFTSEWLPAWLRWDNNTLRGLPTSDATDCGIVVVASYYQGKEVCHLKTSYTLHVVPHSPGGTVYMA
ncbi:hypothetical protein H4R26_002512 [Coemansia thaxteri]|uniref:Uncharacterized protein n=1 Tax=Coemansia thaxteri TaxID=2663907 RepID=A0A9W8EJG2_9FUNG|nr:hypothetical protein H4R26_002512 [Coemansia thaxteri]